MKKILIAVAMLALVGAGVGLYLWNKPFANMSSKSADLTVNAADLVKAYQASEPDANAKYLNKVIQVSGTVGEVTKNDKGEQTIYLDGGDPMARVSCELDTHTDQKDQSFTTGQPVTFKGICTGYLSDVQLNRCVLVQ